jgi:hypothetical protein
MNIMRFEEIADQTSKIMYFILDNLNNPEVAMLAKEIEACDNTNVELFIELVGKLKHLMEKTEKEDNAFDNLNEKYYDI